MKEFEVEVKRLTSWELVANKARTTAWKPELGKEPSSAWKKKILKSRHSPIEALFYSIQLKNIPYWVSVHYVRHRMMTHFVSSQRDDRNPNASIPRKDKPQGELVNHDMIINAQTLISMSRKRLCAKASPETRAIWEAVKKEMIRIGELEMAQFMQPECYWCGWNCPELQPCGKCPVLADPEEEWENPPPEPCAIKE